MTSNLFWLYSYRKNYYWLPEQVLTGRNQTIFGLFFSLGLKIWNMPLKNWLAFSPIINRSSALSGVKSRVLSASKARHCCYLGNTCIPQIQPYAVLARIFHKFSNCQHGRYLIWPFPVLTELAKNMIHLFYEIYSLRFLFFSKIVELIFICYYYSITYKILLYISSLPGIFCIS